MSVVRVAPPFVVFPDIDGDPLDSGSIYIGMVGLNPEIPTNQIPLFWDVNLTIPALQPIRTLGGFPSRNGSPGNIYTSESQYSISVRNKNGSLVYSDFNVSTENSTSSQGLQCKTFADLIDPTGPILTTGIRLTEALVSLIADTGACIDTTYNNLTSMKGGGTYVFKTLEQQRLDTGDPTWVPNTFSESYLFGGSTYVVILQDGQNIDLMQWGANATANDSPCLQAAIIRANSTNGTIYWPDGSYTLASTINFYSCSLVGESQRGVIINCTAVGSVFVLQETWQYAECKNLRFSGTGTNICFDWGGGSAGMFGINLESLRFTSFNKAFYMKYTLFMLWNNCQFRSCVRGLDFEGGSGTYHNVNQVTASYFDLCSERAISFESGSNGSSLAILTTAFDHCEVGVYCTRPVTFGAACYFERDIIGIDAVNTNIWHDRIYFLGDSTGPSTKIGIRLTNSRLVQSGVSSFADSFGNTIIAQTGSVILNHSGSSTSGRSILDTSVDYNSQALSALTTASVCAGPTTTTIVDLSTTPVNVGSGRLSSSSQYTIKCLTANLSRFSFTMGLRYDGSASLWRVEASSSTTPTLTRISSNSFSISGASDGRTYTFSVSGANGQMTVAADAATVGDTVFTIQGQDNIPI